MASNWQRVVAAEPATGCDREGCTTAVKVGDRLNLDTKSGKLYHVVSEGRCTGMTTSELTDLGRAALAAGLRDQLMPGTVAPPVKVGTAVKTAEPAATVANPLANVDAATLAAIVAMLNPAAPAADLVGTGNPAPTTKVTAAPKRPRRTAAK